MQEALQDEDAAGWKKAMDEEMSALKENKTWSLSLMPAEMKPVACKWIFKRKRDPGGAVTRLKARLVAKGFSQKKGADYTETFSPVARLESIRTIIAIAAHEDLHMTQFDVKTAFLHGELDEEIYMSQPEGYDDGSGRLCMLKRGLYGLKQAPRQWNKTFNGFLLKYGLERSESDNCVYFCKHKAARKRILLSIYVDDGLLCTADQVTMDQMLRELNKEFKITQSDAACYLGLELERDRNKRTIAVRQTGYISELLEWSGMSDCKPAKTPGDPKVRLTKSVMHAEEEVSFPYRETVGKVMYAMVCTRPDIAFQVSQVARFVEKPGREHVIAVKRILRYLRGTKDLKLVFGGGDLTLVSFADADHGADPDTRRSVSGRIHLLNSTCRSRKLQRTSCTCAASCQRCYACRSSRLCSGRTIRVPLRWCGTDSTTSGPSTSRCATTSSGNWRSDC